MSLKKEAYKALEDIVGPDNISDEPAILDSYRYQWLADFINPKKKRFSPVRPAAILLPGSTEEVQAIVKACNKYGVKMKPLSGGWGVWNTPLQEGSVQLDLKRMNHILGIDEKNMFAVIEPYVLACQLQVEAMKKGLNCHMIGAGQNCSVLVTSTSLLGASPNGMYMGQGADNLLALEWVTPAGDIVRTGSRACGDGWFCSEGPGPSTRGIVRGHFGGLGGFGIITRIGVKLHPWPGPATYPTVGKVPAYNAALPGNFRAYTVHFPSEQVFADSLHKIWDARIGYIIHRQFNFYGDELQAAMIKIFSDANLSLDNLEEVLADPEVKKLNEEMKCAYQIILAGNSIAEVEWQDKALDEILKETGGKKVKALTDPFWQQFTLNFLLKLATKNTNFLYTGSFVGILGPTDTPDLSAATIKTGEELNRKYQSKSRGGIADTGANAFMGTLGYTGGGGDVYQEQFFFHDPAVPESVTQAEELANEAVEVAIEKKWPPTPYSGHMLAGLTPVKAAREKALRDEDPQPQTYEWQGKIHAAFDPNHVSDLGYPWIEAKK